jgi:hypothetical protein
LKGTYFSNGLAPILLPSVKNDATFFKILILVIPNKCHKKKEKNLNMRFEKYFVVGAISLLVYNLAFVISI